MPTKQRTNLPNGSGTQISEGRNEHDQRVVEAKRQLEKLMIQFNSILQDKTLQENKSQGQQNVESDGVMRLLMAAGDLDMLNSPEGTYALITLLIREALILRNNNNRLEYQIQGLKKEIERVKAQLLDKA